MLGNLISRETSPNQPFLIGPNGSLSVADLQSGSGLDFSEIQKGDVVVIVGDFDQVSVRALIDLIDLGAIVVPLTKSTEADHDYFFEECKPNAVISDGRVTFPNYETESSPLIETFRREGRPGLVLFTSGSTGRPKGILHDLTKFMVRYKTPRPALRTLGLLLFDHIGGLNTLFHTLFNGGLVVSPSSRDLGEIIESCRKHDVELLPATPTFLRMLLMSDYISKPLPKSLRLVTYGTERMEQQTLSELCETFPNLEFRQTYGMSELGILRVKSRARDSLWMQVGGEGVQTKIRDGELLINSSNRMVGYLNAPNPFNSTGWFNTHDIVERDGDWIKIVGRTNGLVNVAGLKFNLSEVEDAALSHPAVALAKASALPNPITGSFVQLIAQPHYNMTLTEQDLRRHLRDKLENHKLPARVKLGTVSVSPRYKKI